MNRNEIYRLFRIYLSIPRLFLLCGLACATLATPLIRNAYSQKSQDAYQLRQDEFDPRKEGIKEHKIKPVTGDKIILLSALITNALLAQAPIPDLIQLGFYTEEKTAASVEIRWDPKLYYVDPIREIWGPGIAIFKWPTEIMQRHQIPPAELYARAIFIERAERRLFPACLYFQDLPRAVEEYRFVVTPLRTMQMLYWIIDVETDSVKVVGAQQEIRANKELEITWDGLDDSGNEVPEGEYLLKLQGTYKPRFGKPHTVSVSYHFYHKTEFTE